MCVCACVRVSAGRGSAGNHTVCELGDANQHVATELEIVVMYDNLKYLPMTWCIYSICVAQIQMNSY